MLRHDPDPTRILVRGQWVTCFDADTNRPYEVFGVLNQVIRIEAAAARAWFAECRRWGLPPPTDPEDRE